MSTKLGGYIPILRGYVWIFRDGGRGVYPFFTPEETPLVAPWIVSLVLGDIPFDAPLPNEHSRESHYVFSAGAVELSRAAWRERLARDLPCDRERRAKGVAA